MAGQEVLQMWERAKHMKISSRPGMFAREIELLFVVSG